MPNRVAPLLGVVMLLSALPLRAQAVEARLTIPVDETQVVSNACTGEDVLLSFSGFISIHLVFNENVAVGQTQIVLDGSGTGISSGSSYVLNTASAQAENIDAAQDGTIEATLLQNLELISLGSSSNLMLQARNHITINANGTVTVFTTEMTSACRG
jgi:hypothetical protein